MAQVVLHVLGGAVGGPGKGAEGGHVDEGPAVEAAHVQGPPAAGGDDPGGLQGLIRQMEAGGEVVGAARGDVAQGRRAWQVHQPRDRLVERAVAAAADHGVELPAQLPGQAGSVLPGLGQPQVHQIAGGAEVGHGVKEGGGGAGAACPGIDDK